MRFTALLLPALTLLGTAKARYFSVFICHGFRDCLPYSVDFDEGDGGMCENFHTPAAWIKLTGTGVGRADCKIRLFGERDCVGEYGSLEDPGLAPVWGTAFAAAHVRRINSGIVVCHD